MSLTAGNNKDRFCKEPEMQAGLVGDMSENSPGVPKVLRCLFEEHRHLAALIHALEGKATQCESLHAGDYFLMHDIVAYMHDYPEHVHHPTENRLFETLLRRVPSRKKAVKRLRNDHEAVARETQDLLDLLDEAIDEATEEREQDIRQACEAFVSHQRAHMQFENQEMFPAAIESLSKADWKEIELHFAATDDPLFGQAVANRHRTLYEYLVSPVSKASEKFTVSRMFSLERLILTVDTLEKGTGSWWARIQNLGEEISGETRSVISRSLKPAGPGSFIGLPFAYTAFLGRSLLDCSNDLARIYTSTAKDTLAIYTGRKPKRAVGK